MNRDSNDNQKAERPGESTLGAMTSWGRVLTIAILVTLAVAYQLYRTALMTANYEGMWFSLAHTVIVAIGAVCALRPACQPCESNQ